MRFVVRLLELAIANLSLTEQLCPFVIVGNQLDPQPAILRRAAWEAMSGLRLERGS